jgi:hypothetical protein
MMEHVYVKQPLPALNATSVIPIIGHIPTVHVCHTVNHLLCYIMPSSLDPLITLFVVGWVLIDCNSAKTCATGTCSATGTCNCPSPVTGPNCADCLPNYYNAPSCVFCNASTTCNGHGTCDTSGACTCFSTHKGASCNTCADENNYYGSNCLACPGLLLYGQKCGGAGTCASGYSNTGKCTCIDGYFGDDCISPGISAVTPRNGPTEGNTPVHIEGLNFLAGTSVATLNPEQTPVALQSWGLITAGATYIDTASEPMSIGSGLLGNRTIVVKLASGAQSRYNWFFLYDPPLITSFDPPQGIAGDLVTVRGRSFGNNGTILFDGVPVGNYSRAVGSAYLTEVYFRAPIDIGKDHQVTISWGRGSNVSLWSYRPPIISDASPAAPTSGNTPTIVTINGVGFGYTAAPPTSITIGGVICGYIAPHTNTQIKCSPGVGRGTGVAVAVTAGGLTGTANVYSFRAPYIRGASGCTNQGNRTIGCATKPNGAITLTIDGLNFGSTTDDLTVYIGDNQCQSVTMEVAHYRLSCKLPAGFGQNVSVIVTVAGLSGSAPYVDYASPIIAPNTLLLLTTGVVNFTSTNVAHIVCETNAGGQSVQFDGQYFGDDQLAVVVTYGPSELPSLFPCTVIFVSETRIQCTTTAGVGGGMHFQVKVAGVQSNLVADYYSYPPPSITPNTIRFPAGMPTSSIIGNTTQGEEILFNGQYFGAQLSNLLSVTYVASVNATETFVCKVLTPSDTNSEIHCKTVPGDGLAMVFTVCVGYGSGALCATGTDTYSYPVPPIVSTVSGCPTDTSDGRTTYCPTDGLISGGAVYLTITGQYFGLSGAAVLVGESTCTSVVHTSGFEDRSLSCILPSGVGYGKAVVVSQQLRFSRGVDKLDYAPPTLLAVSGCVDGVDEEQRRNTYDCPRSGGSLMTITGTNFGVGPAKILVGGVSCDNVTHDASNPHIRATCTLAAGNAEDRTVLLIQNLGEYSDATAENVITVSYTQCQPGYYSVGADVVCHACAVGTYTALQSSAGCVSCSFGTYSNVNAATACTPCAAGNYTNLVQQTSCSQCELGKYYSSTGATICSPCTTGRFSANPGQATCAACGIGRYQDVQGNTTCIDCPSGKYVSAEGLDQCLSCEPGYYNPDPGKDSCRACPEGSYSTTGKNGGAFNCTLCPAGQRNDKKGKAECTPCLSGTYSDYDGAQECTPCPLGSFASESGRTECDLCSPGTYSGKDGAQECTSCQLGAFSTRNATTACDACGAGTYQPKTGQSVCLACGNGTITTKGGQYYCSGCTAGTYTDHEGQASCLACAMGSYSLSGAQAGSTGCALCAPGRYSGSTGYTGCALCGPGQYSSEYGLTACKLCDIGKFQDGEGAQSCISCEPGKTAASYASLACDACLAGKFNPYYNQSSCQECPTGEYQATEGQSSCIPCSPGYQAPYTASIECISCTSGKYIQAFGASECSPCSEGNYSDTKQQTRGITDCLLCPVGRYIAKESASDCLSCDPGSYTDIEGQTECTPCPIGRWQDTAGSSECYACSNGTYNIAESQRVCALCDYGKYQPLEGKTFCLDCNAGSAQGVRGRDHCDECIAGEYMPSNSTSSCFQCERGKWSVDEGRIISCNLCGNGTYVSVTGQTGCDPCPIGRYNPVEGQDQCTACSPGTYLNATGETGCLKCGYGSYQNRVGQSECDPCPLGKYVAGEAQSSM